MNKAVLLVTPYFAPQAHAAMFRVHKLAKYLPQFGWKPYVLTTDTNYLYNENRDLLDELPPEVEVHRARYVEPTLRGLRMALGGEDRTFATMKRDGRLPSALRGTAAPMADARSRAPRAARVYQRLLKSVVQSPDPYWTWRRPALALARRLIRNYDIPVVYTTTLPYTTIEIGRTLQAELGCRWVMDLRDPGTYSTRMSSTFDSVYLRQRRIEHRGLLAADAVTVLSSAYKHIFEDLHGPGLGDRITFIPTGLDEAYVSDRGQPERGALVFTGEYLPEYGDAFWRIFRTALDREPTLERQCRVDVIGHEALNRSRLEPILKRFGLEPVVRFTDHLPQSELYRRVTAAQAGLLIPGEQSHWWTNFAKMVDYIALQRPVLALVPNPSEARKELERAGIGVFLDGCEETAAQRLIAFLQGDCQVGRDDSRVTEAYTAAAQVQAFAEIFSSLEAI